MDSQHKQELKQNDLQNFVTHFGEWWGKHQTKVLLIAIVAAVSILGVRWMKASAAAKHDATYYDLNISTSPADFKAIAADAGSDSIRAIAALRAGDLLLQEATIPSTDANEDVTPKQREAKLEEANNLYKQVVSLDQNSLLTLNARMGMASVAESLGKWEDAAKVYESVKAEAAESNPIFAQRATAKLALIDRVKTSPTFAPEPKPTKPDDGKTGDAKTGDTKSDDGKTGDTKSGDGKTGDTKSGDTKAGDGKTSGTKSGDTKAPTKDAATPAKDAVTPTKSGDAKSGTSKTTGDAKKAGDSKDGTKAK